MYASFVMLPRKHELKRAEESGEDVAALRAHYIEEYKEEFFNPYKAAEYGKFEDVIEPAESRRVIIRGWKRSRA